MKALGVGIGEVELRDIEVTRASSGQPAVLLHRGAADLARAQGVARWSLSLTHTNVTALAILATLPEKLRDDRLTNVSRGSMLAMNGEIAPAISAYEKVRTATANLTVTTNRATAWEWWSAT